MENKFKIGDKVKFINIGKVHSPKIEEGTTGIIEEIILGRDDCYLIWFNKDTGKNLCYENELELVQTITNKSIEGNFPKRVIFNDKKGATCLLWEDGTKTIVKCHNDKFDERMGFLIAFYQKFSGISKNQANKYLDSLVSQVEKSKEKELFISDNGNSFVVGEQIVNGDVEYAQMYSKEDYTLGQAVEDYYHRYYSKTIETNEQQDELVFSVYKFSTNRPDIQILLDGWQIQCDGKTVSECSAMEFGINANWLVPRSEFKPYKSEV